MVDPELARGAGEARSKLEIDASNSRVGRRKNWLERGESVRGRFLLSAVLVVDASDLYLLTCGWRSKYEEPVCAMSQNVDCCTSIISFVEYESCRCMLLVLMHY